MDLREKALALSTLAAIVVAFAYFNVALAGLAALAALPFSIAVLLQ